jgi:hypothetical protein
MRRITQESINSFNNGQSFKKGNTAVIIDGNIVRLSLHGNVIASRNINEPDYITITNCGWSTNTTKERLNGLDGVSIVQKDFSWYLNGELWNGGLVTVNIETGQIVR